MEKVREAATAKTDSTSSTSNVDGAGAAATDNRPVAAAAATEIKKAPTVASALASTGPRRHSTRSVKAPTPFSPPMGGNKGVSTAAKRAIGGSASGVSDHKGRFVPILYDMVEETHEEQQDMISWSRDGKSFTIDPNHPGLETTIEGYFSHGRLRSLQRQLNTYGFTMEGTTYQHPKFYRGMGAEELLAIRRNDGPEDGITATGASTQQQMKVRKNSVGGDDWSIESLPNFAQNVHTMLEECNDASIMRWSAGGKAFVVDPHHPGLEEVLKRYFQHKNYLSFHRQLNQYGWTKPQAGDYAGMLFNPAFYRGMPERNFDLIRRKDSRDYIPLAKQLRLAEKAAKTEKQIVKNKTAGATSTTTGKVKRTKKKPSNTGANLPPPPAAYVVAKSGASEGGRKAKKSRTSESMSTTTTDKKRKNGGQPPLSETRPKKKKKMSEESLKARKKIEDYAHLHAMFDSWTLFNIPPDLKSHIKKKRVKKSSNLFGKEGVESIGSDAKFLICEETMPDWLAQDEKETLKELEDMIIRDRRQRQVRQDSWSRKYSIAKGKTLPPSKFNRPTNKWQKVTPGDRIDVFWADDQQYYTAKVIKNQEGSAYFHLYYEQDGAQEWLDLSREDFKLLGNETLTGEVAPESPSRLSTLPGVDETPRKDNRRFRPWQPSLPDNYAHLAPYLRYSWEGVNLGKENGTPAYNKFIKMSDPTATSVTPLEILQDIRALRTQGFSAQPDVALLLSDAANNGVNTKMKVALRDLQEDIFQDHDKPNSAKNFEETLATVRRVTDHWDVRTLIGNMQKMETRVSALDEREARILEKLRKKNLI